MGGTFVPPPLSSREGPNDQGFVPPPLSSHQGPDPDFVPPPLSSRNDDTPEHPGPPDQRKLIPPILKGQYDPSESYWSNYWRGSIGKGVLGIPRAINRYSASGVEQAVHGGERIAGSGTPPKGSTTGREIAGGVSDIIRGGGKALAPYALPVAAVTAPIPTAIALASGGLVGWGAESLAALKLDPEYAALIGDLTGMVAGGLGPKVAGALAKRMLANPSGAVAELVKFAKDHNIPLSNAAQRGIENLRARQAKALQASSRTKVARESREATRAGLERTADQLRGGPAVAPTPTEAAKGVVRELEVTKATRTVEQKAAYSELERIEKANEKDVVVGHRRVWDENTYNFKDEPIIERIGLPADLTQARPRLTALIDEAESQMTEAEKERSRGLVVLKNIVKGKDQVSATKLDNELSAIKSMLRGKVNPRSRRLLQGALDELEPVLAKALAPGGQDATDALQFGRDMTIAKYEAERTLKGLGTSHERQFPKEPVALFRKFAASGDANAELLERVKLHAPRSIPAVGQALLQGLFDTALGRNETYNPARALELWQALGDKTKEILFSPKQIGELDKWFRLADYQGKMPQGTPSAVATGRGIDYNVLAAAPGVIGEVVRAGKRGPLLSGLMFAGKYGGKAINAQTTRWMARRLWMDTGGLETLSSPFAQGAGAAAMGRGVTSNIQLGARPAAAQQPAAPLTAPHAAMPKGEIVPEDNLNGILRAASRDQHVDLGLMRAIQRTENAPRDPNAVSYDKKGNPLAHGLMQMMPATFQQYARPGENINNPEDNVNVAARFLHYLTHDWKYKNDRRAVIAAYNAGSGAVEQHGGKVPPYPETQTYVRRVMGNLP